MFFGGDIMNTLSRVLSAAILMAGVATGAQAQQLITNGGFETGSFAGWNANVQGGSNGSLYINGNGNNTPYSGFSAATNPTGGNYYAITDQGGPGSYSLTQGFTLATATTVHISFDYFANNQAGAYYQNGRDSNTSPNQNALVDILFGGSDPFSENGGDVAASLLTATTLGVNDWSSWSGDVTLGAGSYLIRFAETDNQGFFQLGVDNVSVIGGAVPEPASWAMMLGGFGLVGGALRRRRASVSFA